MTTLQPVERFPALSAASNPSDITEMAVGQRRVMFMLTLFLDKIVRYPQYVHRTELESCDWLLPPVHAGRSSATCPQPRPGGTSAAGCALQAWADYSQTGLSDDLVGYSCVTGFVGATLDLECRTVDVRWPLPLTSYFYQKTLTRRRFAVHSIPTQLQKTPHRSPPIRDRHHGPPRISHRITTYHSRRNDLPSIFGKPRF